MPQLLKENEVSFYIGEKHIQPYGTGGGTEDFIYDFDLASLVPEGEYELQPDTMYEGYFQGALEAMEAAYQAGKNVYARITVPNLGTHLLQGERRYYEFPEDTIIEFVFNGVINDYGILTMFDFWIITPYDNMNCGFKFFEINTATIGQTPYRISYDVGGTDITLEPNVYYEILDYAGPITVALSYPFSMDVVNEYTFSFYCLDTPVTLSLPYDVILDRPLTLEPYTKYEVSIVNNFATWSSWEIPE